MKSKRSIELTFILTFVSVFMIAFGILPRTATIPLALILSVFAFVQPLSNSVILFSRLIPFFIAIPITLEFDSFNIWRIFAAFIFLKWYLEERPNLIPKNTIPRLLSLMVVFMFLSLITTSDPFVSIKRIIYFTNLSFVPIVAVSLMNRKLLDPERLFKNLAIPALIVTAIGFIQLASAFLVDIVSFHIFWARIMNLGFYGAEWASIAMNANTWFAYYGEQLSLRMFSTFPDSHSFPIYVLMSIPFVYAVIRKSWVIYVMLFAAILSGTRGIWLAVLAPMILSLMLYRRIKLWKHFVVFILLFAAAYPIFAAPQFYLTHNSDILKRRLRSIIDLSETSNSGRIKIWKKTLSSIASNPVFGVGIGNFPVVLDEDVYSTRAGSSAHNLYLHVAVELGIIAGLIFILAIFKLGQLLYRMTFLNYDKYKDYAVSALLYLTWSFAYFMTDVTLFDERIFLLMGFHVAIIYSRYNG